MGIDKTRLDDLEKEENQIILVEEKGMTVLDSVKINRLEMLNADYYLDYSVSSYNSDYNNYIKYKIKERMIDKNNNLLLSVEKEN